MTEPQEDTFEGFDYAPAWECIGQCYTCGAYALHVLIDFEGTAVMERCFSCGENFYDGEPCKVYGWATSAQPEDCD